MVGIAATERSSRTGNVLGKNVLVGNVLFENAKPHKPNAYSDFLMN